MGEKIWGEELTFKLLLVFSVICFLLCFELLSHQPEAISEEVGDVPVFL